MVDHMAALPSLYYNGAVDADSWRPVDANLRNRYGTTTPEAGDLVGWRYAAWLVHEIRPYQDVDLTDRQREKLDAAVAGVPEEKRPAAYVRSRPFHLVLRHHNGPLIIKPGEEEGFTRLHDGTREISFTSWPGRRRWWVLTDPYQTCSCHGHVWPCRDYDQAVLAAHQAREMDRLMATAQPGVCAGCLEAISTRQRTVTFPEPSRFVPGAPGPTFHAGRAACWQAAENYERTGRLVEDPGVARVASCPGIRFIHEALGLPAGQRLDCTADPFCTGLHGPAGYRREIPCWYPVQRAAAEGAYARPNFDCGYRQPDRACIGGDLSSGGTSISPTAADVLWETNQRTQRRSRGEE